MHVLLSSYPQREIFRRFFLSAIISQCKFCAANVSILTKVKVFKFQSVNNPDTQRALETFVFTLPESAVPVYFIQIKTRDYWGLGLYFHVCIAFKTKYLKQFEDLWFVFGAFTLTGGKKIICLA